MRSYLPAKFHNALSLAIFLLILLSQTALLAQTTAHPTWQKGVTYAQPHQPGEGFLAPHSYDSLSHLKRKIGAEWIALTPLGYQYTYDSPNIFLNQDPPDKDLRHAIRQAHQVGLKVMLKPHIWLQDRSDEKWRGAIAMRSAEDWQRWFVSYQRFILHYARLAAAEQVELFCVGTELTNPALLHPKEWRQIIAQVRTHYPGPLTYAANWWEEYDRIAFWDALDYIGVNAFFPLSQAAKPPLATLRQSAAQIAQEIAQVHRLTGKPVLFTEVGFKSARGASVRPWTWNRTYEVVDLAEQERAYRAILETFWHQPWFYGMYWWKWYSDPRSGGARHTGFTPQRKPAEQVLAEWYGKAVPTQ